MMPQQARPSIIEWILPVQLQNIFKIPWYDGGLGFSVTSYVSIVQSQCYCIHTEVWLLLECVLWQNCRPDDVSPGRAKLTYILLTCLVLQLPLINFYRCMKVYQSSHALHQSNVTPQSFVVLTGMPHPALESFTTLQSLSARKSDSMSMFLSSWSVGCVIESCSCSQGRLSK